MFNRLLKKKLLVIKKKKKNPLKFVCWNNLFKSSWLVKVQCLKTITWNSLNERFVAVVRCVQLSKFLLNHDVWSSFRGMFALWIKLKLTKNINMYSFLFIHLFLKMKNDYFIQVILFIFSLIICEINRLLLRSPFNFIILYNSYNWT